MNKPIQLHQIGLFPAEPSEPTDPKSDLVTAVLLQTVKQAAGVCQPEGRHLEVVVVLLHVKTKYV